MLQLTPYMRAAVQIIIGLYMLGLAMHLLGVHPFFRYFMPQPPRALTRYVRRKAKSGNDDLVTPVFLGALTVFIPCGVTIAMMALAVGTGNALAGAAVMLAFTLGTTPLCFTLAYTAAKLGARKQVLFLKLAALAVLVLGLVSLEGGLNLAGSPISFAVAQRSLKSPTSDASAAPDGTQSVPPLSPAGSNPYAPSATGSQPLRMTAGYAAYSPDVIKAQANVPSMLEVTSKDNRGCGRAFTIPSLGIQEVLPENGVVTVDLPAQKKGTLEVMCTMGMYFAQIEFE
jgi:sulfite exporter TauE/SafE